MNRQPVWPSFLKIRSRDFILRRHIMSFGDPLVIKSVSLQTKIKPKLGPHLRYFHQGANESPLDLGEKFDLSF